MPGKPLPILLCALLAGLACASPRTPAAGSAFALGTGRVVVAPLNLGMRTPAELRDLDGPVWDELVDYFRVRDRQVSVVSRDDADRIWTEALEELKRSGAPPGLRSASAHFARLLGERAEYDLLLMPSLVLRRAPVRGRYASWDGVRRKLSAPEPRNGHITEIGPPGMHPQVWGLTGTVSGISLYVGAFGPDGGSVYEGLAGLDLLQEATHDRQAFRQTWAVALRRDPLGDADHLRQGVALALERPLPKNSRSW